MSKDYCPDCGMQLHGYQCPDCNFYDLRGEDAMMEAKLNSSLYSVEKEIAKTMDLLIKRARKTGFTENFGQKEIHRLEDKYAHNKEALRLIAELDEWVSNLDLHVL